MTRIKDTSGIEHTYLTIRKRTSFSKNSTNQVKIWKTNKRETIVEELALDKVLLNHMRIEKAAVICHSIGGQIATELALSILNVYKNSS
ncbi:hypothetical protein GC102_32890 [Paenibacillus sp. LMG 31460]|uniref:Alpha/beta hydrolase n=1 Tax=Paenibacillus germinis TaxID=2654979 RepID=A0ABX1ZAZ4_9BACL|nr:alpha/beta hydrolase [Paenibacillus germinis]NOU90502.1 hypothetical protein [Paenibacillus germinis]